MCIYIAVDSFCSLPRGKWRIFWLHSKLGNSFSPKNYLYLSYSFHWSSEATELSKIEQAAVLIKWVMERTFSFKVHIELTEKKSRVYWKKQKWTVCTGWAITPFQALLFDYSGMTSPHSKSAKDTCPLPRQKKPKTNPEHHDYGVKSNYLKQEL